MFIKALIEVHVNIAGFTPNTLHIFKWKVGIGVGIVPPLMQGTVNWPQKASNLDRWMATLWVKHSFNFVRGHCVMDNRTSVWEKSGRSIE